MTETEIVSAYLEGRISRRTLIRRLVAAGVSLGAAASYAQVLRPERAFARVDSDHYPDTSVELVVEDLDRVRNRGRVRVRVRADEDSQLNPLVIRAYLITSHGTPYFLGEKQMSFTGPDAHGVSVPITEAGLASLEGRKRARIKIVWVGYDAEGKLPNGHDKALFEA
jgi:hypothetical protein